jgi:hypothetical protein
MTLASEQGNDSRIEEPSQGVDTVVRKIKIAISKVIDLRVQPYLEIPRFKGKVTSDLGRGFEHSFCFPSADMTTYRL